MLGVVGGQRPVDPNLSCSRSRTFRSTLGQELRGEHYRNTAIDGLVDGLRARVWTAIATLNDLQLTGSPFGRGSAAR